jgi:polar amino acid transport system substrate-binding protein
MNRTRTLQRRVAFLVAPALLLGLAACGKSSTDTTAAAESVVATETTAETVAASEAAESAAETAAPESAAAAETGSADSAAADTTGAAESGISAMVAMSPDCAPDKLALKNAGKLVVGTDSPAYPPWFSDDKPENGKGFESAVAFAVAETMGISKENVSWIKVPFNSSYAPGKKDFDFDINQISITDERKQAADFSDGYFDVNQAVVALKDSPAVGAKTVADLSKLKFGVQQGTTSLEFVTNVVKPTAEPFVYSTNNDAKAALAAKQIDAIVLDLPTAFFVSAVEIEGSVLVGQFASTGGGEQFGMLFEKDSALTPCVNEALAILRSSGKLAEIQTAELATATNVPVFG